MEPSEEWHSEELSFNLALALPEGPDFARRCRFRKPLLRTHQHSHNRTKLGLSRWNTACQNVLGVFGTPARPYTSWYGAFAV